MIHNNDYRAMPMEIIISSNEEDKANGTLINSCQYGFNPLRSILYIDMNGMNRTNK